MLEKIIKKTAERIKSSKQSISLEDMKIRALALNKDTGFPFLAALKSKELSFICEVKKASPSKGIIAHDFPYIEIAGKYEKAGASAISVLTEPDFFMGDNSYLTDIGKNVWIPLLRKDFIVDEYMIYESKVIGADAILLICALLAPETLKQYLELSHSLGMSALVEAHDEAEVNMAIDAGAKIIGVNNRNLKTFEVDISNSAQLKKLIPEDVIFVSESGIRDRNDIEYLLNNGADAVLIGETLMKSRDIEEALGILKGN